jgi:hypothetical protein
MRLSLDKVDRSYGADFDTCAAAGALVCNNKNTVFQYVNGVGGTNRRATFAEATKFTVDYGELGRLLSVRLGRLGR